MNIKIAAFSERRFLSSSGRSLSSRSTSFSGTWIPRRSSPRCKMRAVNSQSASRVARAGSSAFSTGQPRRKRERRWPARRDNSPADSAENHSAPAGRFRQIAPDAWPGCSSAGSVKAKFVRRTEILARLAKDRANAHIGILQIGRGVSLQAKACDPRRKRNRSSGTARDRHT